MLDYERLDVYQCALHLADLCMQLIDGLPRGHATLADQLNRASTSILLNIAEAAGKTSLKERRRFHAIARGSAMECGAIFDVLRIQGALPPEGAVEAKALVVRVVAMLSKLAR